MSRAAVFALTVFAACASPKNAPQPAAATRTGAKDTGGRVVPVKELPQAQRDVLAAYARGGDEWERERADVLDDPALTRFLIDNLIVEMVRSHNGMTGAEPARSRRAFDRSVNELVRIGEPSIPPLVSLLEVSDGIVSALAHYTLSQLGRPAVVAVTPLLDDAAPETRRRALALLANLPHAADREADLRRKLTELAHKDPEWLVRAEASQTLGFRGRNDTSTAPWRAALEPGLSDSDPAVADAAARGLSVLGDARAIPALIDALERTGSAGNLRVFAACEKSLKTLSGAGGQASVSAWREWWTDHKREIEAGHVPGKS
jgi:hypothetical protein